MNTAYLDTWKAKMKQLDIDVSPPSSDMNLNQNPSFVYTKCTSVA